MDRRLAMQWGCQPSWPIQQLSQVWQAHYDFLDGTEDNDIAINFKAGRAYRRYQPGVCNLDALIETNWQPDTRVIVKHIMKWADQVGFNQ